MKKVYEAPIVSKIEFDVEEALMVSVIDPPSQGGGTEIGTEIPLWP